MEFSTLEIVKISNGLQAILLEGRGNIGTMHYRNPFTMAHMGTVNQLLENFIKGNHQSNVDSLRLAEDSRKMKFYTSLLPKDRRSGNIIFASKTIAKENGLKEAMKELSDKTGKDAFVFMGNECPVEDFEVIGNKIYMRTYFGVGVSRCQQVATHF